MSAYNPTPWSYLGEQVVGTYGPPPRFAVDDATTHTTVAYFHFEESAKEAVEAMNFVAQHGLEKLKKLVQHDSL